MIYFSYNWHCLIVLVFVYFFMLFSGVFFIAGKKCARGFFGRLGNCWFPLSQGESV